MVLHQMKAQKKMLGFAQDYATIPTSLQALILDTLDKDELKKVMEPKSTKYLFQTMITSLVTKHTFMGPHFELDKGMIVIQI